MKTLVMLACVGLTGCQYFQAAPAVIADGVKSYCQTADPLSRASLRSLLASELSAEAVGVCLGCPGDQATQCVGYARPTEW